MAVQSLRVPGGISPSAVTNIPEQWNREWFRSFISTQLANADVRNATFTGGLAVDQATVTQRARIQVAVNGVGRPQLTQGVALSVIGNPFNTVQNEQDISASADGQLLRCVGGTSLGFGTVKLADTTGLGSSFTTSGLTAGQVLRASGPNAAAFASVQLADLPPQANDTILGNISGGAASPVPLSQAQLTALVNAFSSGLSGAVPASGGGTANFLRADGNFAAPAYPVGANPTASVGLAAVNGTATTFMRSDGAPALDQTISPTWSGKHLFTGDTGIGIASTGVSVGSVSSGANPRMKWVISTGATDSKITDIFCTTTAIDWGFVNDAESSRNVFMSVTRSAAAINGMTLTPGTPGLTVNGKLGINNTSPPSQVTGWGTPTGAAVVASFPGASATLVQCSEVIAKLITDLKAFGLYGA